MMIARHNVSHPEIAQRRLKFSRAELPKVISYVPSRAASLYGVLDTSWNLVLFGSLLEPGAADIGEAIRLGAQAGAAFFTIAASGDNKVQFRLADGPLITSVGLVNSSLAHSGTWCQAFSLAILAREQEAVESLCRVPSALFLNSSTKSPRFHDLFVDAVQSFWTGAPGTSKIITATRAAMDPAHADVRTPDYDTHHWAPELDLLSCLQDQPRDFESLLIHALVLHQEYYKVDEERSRDPYGFIAMRPLVWAAVAFDRDIPFKIESDYLPMELVRGDWRKP